ncbi:MAG: hypothetical protein V7746_05765 [Halioglobus sp.]
MFVEIRSYHYRPDALAAYKQWATEFAVPYLNEQLDLVGFWIDSGQSPEVLDAPLDALGTANVTWIIRWHSMAQREERMTEVFTSEQWEQVFAQLPGGLDNYLRREGRFAESVAGVG